MGHPAHPMPDDEISDCNTEPCRHPYGHVRQREAELIVGGETVDSYEVMFCTSCSTVVDEL